VRLARRKSLNLKKGEDPFDFDVSQQKTHESDKIHQKKRPNILQYKIKQ
jgi:hypothetical protein